jgi:predicted Fe-Mo cluster-binding NifX family protein
MKIIISSQGGELSSGFDPRFGRAPWFCLYDDQTREANFIENKFADSPSGAGKKASELVVELGAERIISGDFGPKAKDVLDKYNVQMLAIEDKKETVANVIEKINLK